MPYREYAYRISDSYHGLHFTDKELREMLISIIVMTVALYSAMRYQEGGILIILRASERIYVLSAFLAATTAFFFSLFAEKYIAQKLGYFVEYTYSLLGLTFAFISGVFLGLLLALPGRTILHGGFGISQKNMGYIFGAGIATNLILSILFLAGYIVGIITINPILVILSDMPFWINMVLAFFTLLPIRSLPGYSVMNGSKVLYGSLWGIFAVTAVAYLVIPKII